MEFGAARLVRQRHEDQPTELRLTRNDDPRQRREVRARLLFCPRGRAGRHLLEPEGRTLCMTCIAASMIAALLQEDRLDLGPVGLEIETARTGCRCCIALSLQSGTGAHQREKHGEQYGCSGHARFIYGCTGWCKVGASGGCLCSALS